MNRYHLHRFSVTKRILIIFSALWLLSACEFPVPHADKTFGTQNFVSAVSLIELHKVRNGVYPDSLDDLEFLGAWDAIWLNSVRYEKQLDGYDLFVERGWVNEPNLSFPITFKKGLGIKDTNVLWESADTSL